MSPGGNEESSTNQSWFTDEQKERAKVAGAWAGAVAGIGVAAWGIFNAFSDSGAEPATDRKKKKIVGTEDTYMYRGDFEKIYSPVHLEARLSGEPNSIAWEFPSAGTMKVNTDAKCDHTTGRASYGGLVRNDQGAWVVGFYGNMKGKVTILQAELEGIYHGLKLIKERGWFGATIDTDSAPAVELISKKIAETSAEQRISKKIAGNHQLHALIEDCAELSRHTIARVVHTFREGNKCADKMAQLGMSQEMNYVQIKEPPSAIKDLLRADMEGTCYRRVPKKKH